MKNTDILVVGGGPAGLVSAVTAKKSYPSKKVTLVRKEETGIIPCGIPYIFNRLNSTEENILPDKPLEANEVELVIDEVIDVDKEERKVHLKSGDTYSYEKMILALGSNPQLVPIEGIEREGVWFVKKDYEYLERMRGAVLGAKEIVIIGGGFIGVEFAEELSGIENLKIKVVEMQDHCLKANFDESFSKMAEERLRDNGVEIYTNRSVQKIGGDESVEYVELDDGEKLKADLVILSIGDSPNTELAEKIDLNLSDQGGIEVNECLKTNVPDIFAVGDCAQTKDFFTGENTPMMLASIATAEARIAAGNLYQLRVIRENSGTVGVFSTSINGLALAAAGLTEDMARERNFDFVVGEAEAPNRHPGKLPGAEKIKVKLIFSKTSENLLLGGEIAGPESAGEMINILAMAIQQRASIFDFNTWQMATHPLLTSAPTVYPLIAAAQDAMLKLKNISHYAS